MNFIHDDFMLTNETAKKLFHQYAENLPIIDYHCHLNPQAIYENKNFRNAFDLFLSGDHYKWRQMRSNGTDERLITGDGDEFEKWMEFAKAMPYLIGNPLYHWTHLELKRYFGIDEILSPDTANEIEVQFSAKKATTVSATVLTGEMNAHNTFDAPETDAPETDAPETGDNGGGNANEANTTPEY